MGDVGEWNLFASMGRVSWSGLRPPTTKCYKSNEAHRGLADGHVG